MSWPEIDWNLAGTIAVGVIVANVVMQVWMLFKQLMLPRRK